MNTYLIVTRYLSSRTSDCRSYVTLDCKCGGANKPRTKPRVDDEEEEVQVKRRGPYGTKKCSCPFKLKGEQMAICESWQLFVHDGRHNHAIGNKTWVVPSGIAQKIYNVVNRMRDETRLKKFFA
ncbi:hypothetical protein M9H77_22730 [Catharanthus roseus]|uniref:Uncharacterized protein n=1 Tax=Catharanthus roseus TaxID=4058 RepID=A0ACC0ATU4_CATRO|nr:hypothetical protein M9H77_22730 [Catharanthus roseus]